MVPAGVEVACSASRNPGSPTYSDFLGVGRAHRPGPGRRGLGARRRPNCRAARPRARGRPGTRPARLSPPPGGIGGWRPRPTRRPWPAPGPPGRGRALLERVPPRRTGVVRRPVPGRTHGAPGRSLAADRHGSGRPGRLADGHRQDADRVPGGHRRRLPRPRRRAAVPSGPPEVVYVSPLRALAADVHENLQLPLAGIRQAAATSGSTRPTSRSAVRTGDTRRPSGRPCAGARPTCW